MWKLGTAHIGSNNLSYTTSYEEQWWGRYLLGLWWDSGLLLHTISTISITENCPAPTNVSGYTIVDNIRSIAQTFGSVKLFKAYLEVSEHVPLSRPLPLLSELQSSGVSLTDCPHNGRKDVADKMIIGTYVFNITSFTSLNTKLFSGHAGPCHR